MYSILPYSFHMCSILLYSSLLYFILLYSILSNPISPFVFFPSDPYLFYLISSYLIRSFPGLSYLTRSSYPIFSDLIGCSAFFFYLILSEPVWSYLIQYLKLCWIRVEPQLLPDHQYIYWCHRNSFTFPISPPNPATINLVHGDITLGTLNSRQDLVNYFLGFLFVRGLTFDNFEPESNRMWSTPTRDTGHPVNQRKANDHTPRLYMLQWNTCTTKSCFFDVLRVKSLIGQKPLGSLRHCNSGGVTCAKDFFMDKTTWPLALSGFVPNIGVNMHYPKHVCLLQQKWRSVRKRKRRMKWNDMSDTYGKPILWKCSWACDCKCHNLFASLLQPRATNSMKHASQGVKTWKFVCVFRGSRGMQTTQSAGLTACLIGIKVLFLFLFLVCTCFCSWLVLVPLFSCCAFLLHLNQGPPPSL